MLDFLRFGGLLLPFRLLDVGAVGLRGAGLPRLLDFGLNRGAFFRRKRRVFQQRGVGFSGFRRIV